VPDFDFDGNDLARLAALTWSPALATRAALAGTHRVRRAGQGSDFLDYRSYAPGDDVRRIDWAVYARLRQPFIRVLEHEDTLFVSLLVDVSRSMDAGAPRSKAALACQLASGLAYIALAAGDHVTAATFSAGLAPPLRNLRGKGMMPRLMAALRAAPTGGTADLPEVTRAFCRDVRHRGLVVILSDFLGVGDVEESLTMLVARRFRVLLVQILDPIDRGEGLRGPIRLRDSETGRTLDMIASEEQIALYQARLAEYCDNLHAMCVRRGQHYLPADTSDSWLGLLATELREQRLLR
jgi:uncharacterized protein (DUF58 family)